MLRKVKSEEFDTCVETAYAAAMQMDKTSFPVYTDGIKTKQDFVEKCRRGFARDTEELLAFEKDGEVLGLIHYAVFEEENYLGIQTISVWKNYGQALAELLSLWGKTFPGYEWSVYFPEENTDAISFLNEHGFPDTETQDAEVLFFRDYVEQVLDNHVRPVCRENYELFSRIHTQQDMYWTSEMIFRTLPDWRIFVYEEAGETAGAIYYHGGGKEHLEIFGLDFKEGEGSADRTEALLAACLNQGKRDGAVSMYFFHDAAIGEITKKLGFQRVTAAHYFHGACQDPHQ